MQSKKRSGQLMGGMLALVTLMAASTLAAQPIAVERLGASRLTVEPQVAFERAVLRVSGPQGYQLSKIFEGGALITVDLFADQVTSSLPDGRYRYEVVFLPGGQVFADLFFVERGLPVSRETKRAQLAGVRDDLARPRHERRSGPVIPQGYYAADFIGVDDAAMDGITYNAFDSNAVPAVHEYWILINDYGDFKFDENSVFYPPGTTKLLIEGGTGNLGSGTTTPFAPLHVARTDGTARVLVDENSSTVTGRTLLDLQNNGNVQFFLENTDSGDEFQMSLLSTVFQISSPTTGLGKFRVKKNGGLAALTGSTNIMDLDAAGNLTVTSVTQTSSREVKRNVAAIDSREVLDKVVELPIAEWSYKKENPKIRHLGPMAEDFHALFGLGKHETGITSIDSSGVALAAIQGLNHKVEEKDARIAELSQQNAELEARLRQLEEVVQALTARSESLAREGPPAP